ncbi:MAG: galactose mutarotase [Ignavibacteriaceae bacterium]|nr:galactose mutarotase [Ignavibacteriaceae bacterium]
MITKELFGKLSSGEEVYLYTLTNNSGMKVQIINYGAIVVSLYVPDKFGKLEDVVFGFDDVKGYENDNSFIGTIVGRYGNRINKSKIVIDGIEYQLTSNEGANQLHGGPRGFFKVLWDVEYKSSDSFPSLKLKYHSPDGEEGYPGNVDIEVTYSLTKYNELRIDYSASTDKPTVLNPTHHSYFNLSGNFTSTILDDVLMLDADFITPIDSTLIPTGEFMKVQDTPFDFRNPRKIGERIRDDDEQLKFGSGYDHNWVLNKYDGTVRKVGTLYNSSSGRLMEIYTDQPGIQFYSGNFINGTLKGKNGIIYKYRTALCLETQHYPDSPNHPAFPSTRLNPGELYQQTTIYKFKVE